MAGREARIINDIDQDGAEDQLLVFYAFVIQ
jgi:hypothetical protein